MAVRVGENDGRRQESMRDVASTRFHSAGRRLSVTFGPLHRLDYAFV